MTKTITGIGVALILHAGLADQARAQTPEPKQSGTLGLQFACTRCEIITHWADGTRTFRFSEPPVVIVVNAGGPAAVGGLQAGDTITNIDGESLLTEEGGNRFANIRVGAHVSLTVRRTGQVLTLPVTAQQRETADSGLSPRGLETLADALGRLGEALPTSRDQPLYSGTFGGIDVRIDGPGRVSVTVADDCVLLIRIGDQRITLRRSAPCGTP